MDTLRECKATQISTQIKVFESSQVLVHREVHLMFQPSILPNVLYCDSETFYLNSFVLNSEHNIICHVSFENDARGKFRIRLRIQSKLIRKVTKIHFSADDKFLVFEDFKIISIDPFECLSNDNIYAYDFPETIDDGFSSGFICYEIIDQNLEKSMLKNCLETGDYHDLTIKLDDGKEFKVHKMVLASRSPVFKKMIDANMMEKETGVIRIKDVEPQVMQEILNFIYSQPCDLSRSPHGIFQTAHLYELKELADQSREYMARNIRYDNFIGIGKLVGIEAYQLKNVKCALNDFMTREESKIVKNPDFVKFLANNMQSQSIDYLFRLCMQYNLNVKEKVVTFILNNLNAVLRNPEFAKLLRSNPNWSVDIFGILGTKFNPVISSD